MKPIRIVMPLCLLLAPCCVHLAQAQSASSSAADVQRAAAKALAANRLDEAIKLAGQAIAAAPNDHAGYALRAQAHIAAGNSKRAVADLDRLLQMNPDQPRLLEMRGTEKFKLRQFKDAIADFDRECKLEPAREPWHWKRGLAYYYAGQYAKGRDQFQQYHNREDNDVENAVWRVMCMARMKDTGLEKAQQQILVVRRDPRVPMMEAYALFAGKAKPDDVLAAIQRGSPDDGELHRRMFYGHLYLGLYFDLVGEPKRAHEHLATAVKHPIEHFMWDIAKLHLGLINARVE